MLMLERTSNFVVNGTAIIIAYKTCDSCGVEHGMVEYLTRIKDGNSEATCPSCGKHHLYT